MVGKEKNVFRIKEKVIRYMIVGERSLFSLFIFYCLLFVVGSG